MKRLLLGVLLLCPAMASADNSSIAQTYNELSSYRVVAGVKSGIQAFLAGYAFYHGVDKGGHFMTNLKAILGRDGFTRANFKAAGDNGVVSGGMFYTSYLLACHAWKNAKQALAIK